MRAVLRGPLLPGEDKGLSFISNRLLKEGTFSASEWRGSNPRRLAQEEQGMPALTSRLRGA